MKKSICVNGIWGFQSCPAWLKELYRKTVNYNCQECHKNESIVGKLIPHRLKRGSAGGLYTVCILSNPNNNVKIICRDCHKKIHFGEIFR